MDKSEHLYTQDSKVLDAELDEDGVYRVPSFDEPVTDWRFIYGGYSTRFIFGILNKDWRYYVTGT